jgi:hypothetical protein
MAAGAIAMRMLFVTNGLVNALYLMLLMPAMVAQEPNSLRPNRREEVTSRVSPVMEIEILDPNKDARGNPAITLKNDEYGRPQVEIPPCIIVHRYYYTGDRSFRGPDLPGGPTIVVVQNPRDGQQVYLPVQMLPGSPIVEYSERSIVYDFGNRSVILTFPKCGDPVVSYRNGRPMTEKAAKVLGVGYAQAAWANTRETMAHVREKTSTVAKATCLTASNIVKPVTLPAQHLARLIPGQAALTDPNLEAKVIEESALRKREREIRQADRQVRRDEVDIPVGF